VGIYCVSSVLNQVFMIINCILGMKCESFEDSLITIGTGDVRQREHLGSTVDSKKSIGCKIKEGIYYTEVSIQMWVYRSLWCGI